MRGKTVAILGLTFKPNTDDMRDAPSISIISALQDMGAKVRAYDPVGIEAAKQLFSDVTYGKNAYDCAEGADALVIVTEWEQFRGLDLGMLKGVMRQPVLVDLAQGLSVRGRDQARICLLRRRIATPPEGCDRYRRRAAFDWGIARVGIDLRCILGAIAKKFCISLDILPFIRFAPIANGTVTKPEHLDTESWRGL